MAPPSTTSRRKRQFQPSSQQTLDAFLARNTPPSLFPSASAPAGPSHPESAGFPPQPDYIQSSLLHVGLRVRKSVPEGYKTHKTVGDGIYLDEENLRPASSAPAALMGTEQEEGEARARELVPFCGIHRVGGYGVQPSASMASVPSLVLSSQESGASTASDGSTPSTPTARVVERRNERKRLLDYDDELLDDAFGPVDADGDSEDEEVAGLAFKNVLSETRQNFPMSRSRSPFGAGLRSRQQIPRRSRGGMRGGMGLVDDFPEAEFLKPVDDMDVEQ